MIVQIRDICSAVYSGGTPNRKHLEYYEGGDIPWLNTSEVVFNRIYKTEKHITQSGLKNSSAKWIPENSVIVAMYGATAGRTAIAKIPLTTNQACCNLIIDPEKADYRYVYYYLYSKYQHLLSMANGGAQQNLNAGQIKEYVINLPDLQTQKKIADILDLLDSKIELNNTINNNLEQQAKALFKSWFIDFEPFGGVQPPEMKFVPLQELCKVVTKGTTPTTLGKPFTSSGINFIKAESILDSHSIDSSKFAFIDEETNALLKRSVIKANDIVFTIAGTLGRFAMVDNSVLPANTNQAVAIIRPDENKVTPAYLYSFFIGNWHNEYYSKRIQQAVQANLSLTTIKSLPIAVLSKTTMNNYDELVSPLFALMKGNEEENRRLSELRDTLLPKLMSGELDVSNIDL